MSDDEPILLNQTMSEAISAGHAREWVNGWQYCRVWRFARPDDPHPKLQPSEGEWELNGECGSPGMRGRSVTVPVWSDGSVVMQKTHWRRKHVGILNRQLSEQVRWDGDPHPYG